MEVNAVIYMGDTNINLLSNRGHDTQFLRRLLKDYNAVQIINEPTRVTTSSATLLDHIIVDKSLEIKRTAVINTSSVLDCRRMKISDHNLVYCNILIAKEKRETKLIRYRDFSKFDLGQAVARISETKWEEVNGMQNVDDIERFIATKIRDIFNEHAPTVCKKVTKKKPLGEVKKLIDSLK